MTTRFPLFWRVLASVLFAAAFVFFCWRGPGRGLLGPSYDLSMLYAGAAARADGGNPYVLADAAAAMAARGGTLDASAVLLYPPSALAALWPLTWLPWSVACVAWLVAQLFACIGLAAGLQRLAGGRLRRGLAGWLFMMCLLLWAPIHTGFAVGQVALPVAFLMVWSLVLAEDGKRVGAGILLGLAVAIKPQLALALLPVLLLRRKWFTPVFACLVAGTLFYFGARRLENAGQAWREQWQFNLHAFTHGGYGDVTLAWARAQMIQASALLASLGVVAAVAVGYGITAFAGCFWLLVRFGQWRRTEPLALLAVAALLALLAGYHRSYDAVLALVPMAYGLRLVAENVRSVAGWSLVASLAVFLTPGGAVLVKCFPQQAAVGPWWVQFQTLALLLAVGVVCVAKPARLTASPQELP